MSKVPRRKIISPPIPLSKNVDDYLAPISFLEARRLIGSPYCAWIREMHEEGCKTSAYYIKNIAAKEDQLIKSKTISFRIYDNKDLMMAYFENMKAAEKGFILNTTCGFQATYKCLLRILRLLEPYRTKYAWLVPIVYKIIASDCENFEKINIADSEEVLARIYYRSAKFLGVNDDDLADACKYMEKALQLSRREAWISEQDTEIWGLYPTMHLQAGRNLASYLLRYADIVAKENPEEAAELAFKAILAISEVDMNRNKMEYFKASVMCIKFLILSESYWSARKMLKQISNDMKTLLNITDPAVTSELCMHEATCLSHLNECEAAIKKYKEALKISNSHDCKHIEAEASVSLGKVYLEKRGKTNFDLARLALMRSQKLYTQLDDKVNRMKVHYILAKLKADEIFPLFMDVMKQSVTNYSCNYIMRQWKNRSNPFWEMSYMSEIFDNEDDTYCLMNEKVFNAPKKQNLYM